MNDQREIIKADKRLRITIIILFIIIIGATLLAYTMFQRYFLTIQNIADSDPEAAIMKMVNILKAIVYVNPIIFLLFFVYFISLGYKTFKSKQYPPPGVKVIRDTYMIRGKKAKGYAIGLWITAIILIVLALTFSFMMNNLVQAIT